MSAPRTRSIFERNPRTTLLLLGTGAALAAELGLRLLAPQTYVFVHQARQVHAYSERYHVDLRPRRSALMRLRDARGDLFFNFVLTTNGYGFRCQDRDRDDPLAQAGNGGCREFVHAVGDSYTMGWGLEQASSYPAQLDELLPPQLCVVNLGVDGYGTIGATEKSMALADRFPPSHAIYLFSPNDFADDERALRVSQRSRAGHLVFQGLDVLRRHSYLANTPYVVQIRRRFAAALAAPGEQAVKHPASAAGRPEDLLLSVDPARLRAAPAPHPSLAQILKYRDFLQRRGARLSVLILSDAVPSLALYRHCRDNGIPAYVFELPPYMTLAGDGHFNRLGNRVLARLALAKALGRGSGEEPGASP